VIYAVLRRDLVAIHLRRSGTGAGRSFCYLEVADADRLAAELQAAGATFKRGIEDSSYEMRDFEIVDCCGNVIGIGASLPG
jgi:predicted enzyme related to lactoylglutathione lyase